MMQLANQSNTAEAVVAGHICLDIIPQFPDRGGDLQTLLRPGTLTQIGPATLSTGGTVSNAGLALHRLGIRTRLMGKVGDDEFGLIIRQHLASIDPALAQGMIISKGEHSSYTVVVSVPGVDRIFLHYSGTNDTYGSRDVATESLTGARLFHFGYPPVMKRLYSDGGVELAEIFRRAKSQGLTSSMDMTQIDPRSEAGRIDWRALLGRVLPHVDIFLPSIDEILFMLGRTTAAIDGPLLDSVAQQLLDMGSRIVVLKLGDQGLYLRTTAEEQRLADLGGCAPSDPAIWTGRQIIAPCFDVNVVGTTGSGDCTIAGFLAGMLRKLTPEQVVTAAVGVGAFCVEQPDATSGVPTWAALEQRIASGWARRDVTLALPHWRWIGNRSLCLGPADQSPIANSHR